MSWDASSWKEEHRGEKDWKSDDWKRDDQTESKEAAADAVDFVAGVYKDDWGSGSCEFVIEGGKLFSIDPGGNYPREEGILHGSSIEIWKMRGMVSHGKIVFSNGATWTLQSEAGGAVSSDGAHHQAAPAGAAADPWQSSDPWSQGGASSSNSRRPAAAPAAAAVPAAPAGEGCGSWSSRDAAPAASAAAASDGWGAAQQAHGGAASSSGWNTTAAASSGGWGSAASPAPFDQDKQKAARQRDFKAYQDYYYQSRELPGKSPAQWDAEEDKLFQKTSTEGQDFGLYDKAVANISGPSSENIPRLNTFDQLFSEFKEQVPPELMANIRKCGFKNPTPVQKFCIPPALMGRDVMCCAQTGSGKTAAFLIPILASMIKHGRRTGDLQEPFRGAVKPDTLVISPTRELCLQIYDDSLRFCHRTQHRVLRVYGQETAKDQIKELAKGADLLIATPGRLWDFVSSQVVDVSEVHCLVLDEADRMLAMKMEEFIRDIVEKFGMPSKEQRQTMMFSATFPEACQILAKDYLYEHLFIAVGTIGGAVCTVEQQLEQVAPEDKLNRLVDVLNEFLDTSPTEKVLVFTNSKEQAKGLDEKLFDEHKIETGALHGDHTQFQREENLAKFRRGEIQVLIATDVASRGLDIPGVGKVVNYDLPWEVDIYVQRIGRTGRIGHRGKALTFISVGKDGSWNDKEECIKALPKIMADAGCEVPRWLQEKVDGLEAGVWVKTADAWSKDKDRTDARQQGTWEPWSDTKAKRSEGGEPGGGDWGNGNSSGWQDNSATAASSSPWDQSQTQ